MTPGAFAAALRLYVELAEQHVYLPAFPRIGWLKMVRFARLSHHLHGVLGRVSQRAGPLRFEAIRVKRHTVVVLGF